MFTKQDDQFADMAFDPERRRATIAGLSQRRTIIFWIAMFMFALGLLESWQKQLTLPTGTSFMGLLFISIVFKMESDLRLLKVIEWREQVNDNVSPSGGA